MTLKQFIWPSLVLLIQFPVNAQQHPQDEDESEFMLGAMIASEQSIYLGGENRTQVFPMLMGQWGRFYLQGPSLGAYLYQNENWSFSTSIDLSGFGDDDRDKSAELADMNALDSAFFANANIDYESEWGELGLSVGSDVSGTHDGTKVSLSYSYPFAIGGWRVEPQIGAEWNSKEVTQYYYGVTESEVRIDRSLYTPDASTSYQLGVTAMYPFMKRHAFLIRAEYQSYSNDITDSPIVDSSSNTSIGLGYMYRF